MKINDFLRCNSVGADTLQVHSRLFICLNKFRCILLYFPIPCCLTMVYHSFIVTNISTHYGGLALEHSLRQEGPRLFFWILFFIQLTVKLPKSSLIHVVYQRTCLYFRLVDLGELMLSMKLLIQVFAQGLQKWITKLFVFYAIKSWLLNTKNTNRNYVVGRHQGRETKPNKNTIRKPKQELCCSCCSSQINLNIFVNLVELYRFKARQLSITHSSGNVTWR